MWDKRTGGAVSSIFGPHLCGDGLDLHLDPAGRTTLLTGSWRPETPLELWDLETGSLIEKVEWKESLLASQPCLLYAAQFSKFGGSGDAGRFIVAGGSGANEARVFDRYAGTMTSHGGCTQAGGTALVGTVTGMARGVFSADWSPVADKVAVGTGDGTVRILDVVDRAGGQEYEKEGEDADAAVVVVAPVLRGGGKNDEEEGGLVDDDEEKYTQAAQDDD